MRPYLELCRVFLTPSAVADSFAGYALACSIRGESIEGLAILPVAAASVLLYWFGMATNDIFDLEKDRTLAPRKPLPSGRLGLRQAWTCAAVLGFGAVGTSLLAAVEVAEVALGIVILAVAYNAGGKQLPVIGNLLMGGCRAGNFLLGAVAATGLEGVLGESRLLLAAAILGLYVAGLTAVSTREEREHRPRTIYALSLPLLTVPVALVICNIRSLFTWLNSGVLALVLAAATYSATRPSAQSPRAALFVRRALGGIFLVDAGALLALSPGPILPLPQAGTLYALFALGWLWKRRWLQSGGADT